MSVASSTDRHLRGTLPHLQVLAEGSSWISLRYPTFRDSHDRAGSIEHMLRQLGGVTAVKVDRLTARIKVRFDPARLDKDQIRFVILRAPDASGHVRGHRCYDAHATVQVARRTRLVVGGVTLAGLMVARLAFGAAILSGGPLVIVGSVATLVCGYPILRSGLRALAGRGPLGTDAMITLATGASLLLGHSVTALAVVCLLDLGEWLQEWVQARTQRSMEALLGEVWERAWVVRHDTEILVPTSEVAIGQRFARLVVPASIGLAVLTLLLTRDPVRAISMLLIACPCATGLSAPSAMTAARHVGARRGIFFRSGHCIESAARIDTIILDLRAVRGGSAGSAWPEAIEAIPALQWAGLQTVMLSAEGEIARLGEPGVADEAGNASLAALRTLVAEAQSVGGRVAVVSDRLGYTSTCSGADLHVVVGSTAPLSTIDLVDVVVAHRDLGQLVTVFSLSRHALGVVRQNYGLTLLAEAGGVLAGFAGIAHPVALAMLHSLSPIGVLTNSARLVNYQPPMPRALPGPAAEPARQPSRRTPRSIL